MTWWPLASNSWRYIIPSHHSDHAALPVLTLHDFRVHFYSCNGLHNDPSPRTDSQAIKVEKYNLGWRTHLEAQNIVQIPARTISRGSLAGSAGKATIKISIPPISR